MKSEVKAMLNEHGHKVVGEVTLAQVFGGMRGVKSMIWETSALDPIEGIRFRGYSIPELREALPKKGNEPLPEALFWLMLVGEIPNVEQIKWLSDQWTSRSNVPEHVFKVIDAIPKGSHPMTQFSAAVTAMQTSSQFARRYGEGLNKSEYCRKTSW